jgi:ABC-type Na+ efflux pump permease subunit
MKIAYGRLVLIALGAFVASAAPEFDAAWKASHIPDTAPFGVVVRALMLSSIEGIRAGIPAMVTAAIAFFMRQDSGLPMFSQHLPEVKTVSEATRDTDG